MLWQLKCVSPGVVNWEVRHLMNRKIERLMQTLRDAIHDALGESAGVAAAMAELERAGHCPSLLVDVSLPAEKEAASIEPVRRDGPLFLTESDDDFLRNIGIGKLA